MIGQQETVYNIERNNLKEDITLVPSSSGMQYMLDNVENSKINFYLVRVSAAWHLSLF